MSSNTSAENIPQSTNQEIDYIKILRILWSRWYWIASILVICITLAYLYLWYTPKVYSTTASLKFEDKSNEISELLKGKYSINSARSTDAESFVIKSNNLLLRAIGKIDYEVFIHIKGRFRTKEMYPFKPFNVNILQKDSSVQNKLAFSFKKLNAKSFKIGYQNGEEEITKEVSFGKPFGILGIKMLINDPIQADGADYIIYVNRKEDILGRITKGLSMREISKGSNILAITQTDENNIFAKDILNALIHEYQDFDGESRKQSATQTIDFINTQIDKMALELRFAQNELKDFKSSSKISSIGSYGTEKQKKFEKYQEEIINIKTENISLGILEQQIKNNQERIYLNFNLEGEAGGFLRSLIDKLNTLLVERSGKLVSYNENSNPILELDKQISIIKEAIIRNIINYRERQNKMALFYENELRKADTALGLFPATEQSFLNLQRTYDINEKIFSYMSEKKLEAEIARSAILPGVSIVNEAPLSNNVIEPQSTRIYTSSLLIGIILSIFLIVLIRIINPYIYDKETVENLSNAPIIGVVKKFPTKLDKSNKQVLSLEKPKSVFAESIRSVRTNLSFLASEKNSKVICITSEISGEGKSFMTINLASTLSLIDKKVVIIAADLRKSKMHKAFEVDNDKGLSTYLSNRHQIEDVLLQTHIESLDFIPSGPNPPNPSELIQSDRMRILIDHLSTIYDYVLIDTAPIGLVSDSIPLIRKADINLFVIRSGVSRINSATLPQKISGEYNLSNVVIVLNAFGIDSLYSRYYSTNYNNSYYNSYYYYADYSGTYGYGYFDDEKPKWWNIPRRLSYHFKKKKDS